MKVPNFLRIQNSITFWPSTWHHDAGCGPSYHHQRTSNTPTHLMMTHHSLLEASMIGETKAGFAWQISKSGNGLFPAMMPKWCLFFRKERMTRSRQNMFPLGCQLGHPLVSALSRSSPSARPLGHPSTASQVI